MLELQRTIGRTARFDDDHDLEPDSIRERVVLGVDQAFLDDRAVSAVVACRAGRVIDRSVAVTPLRYPYVPGLLAFREGPAIIEAFVGLEATPELALFDGSGRIHHRQAGLATHLGLAFDLPSVGVAKGLLCGEAQGSLDDRPAGTRVPVVADAGVEAPPGTLLGYALQTRQFSTGSTRVNPVFVSPGHRVGADTAADLVEALCTDFKLPEPIRRADRAVAEAKADLE